MDIIGDAGIEIHADGSGAKRELDELSEDRTLEWRVKLLNTKVIEKQLNKLAESRVVDIIPRIDQRALRNVQRQLSSLTKSQTFTVIPTLDQRALRNVNNSLKQIGNGAHFKGFHKELAIASYEVEQLGDKLDDMTRDRKVTLRTDLAGTKTSSVRMAMLTRPRIAPIFAKVDKKSLAKARKSLEAVSRVSGFRVLKDIGRSFKDFVKNIDKAAPKMAMMASAGGSLIGVMGSLVGWIGLAATQLASLAALALPLPALFLGAGAAIGVLVVALKDTKEVLKDYGDDFTQLGEVIKQGFWYEFEGAIRNLLDTAMPMLNRELSVMSSGLGNFLGVMANTAASEANMDRIRQVLGATSTGINNASDGMDEWTNGLLEIAGIGARYLPDIGTWFAVMGQRFDDWVTKNDENGNFFRWVEDGIATFKVLWGMVGDIIGIFGGLGAASEEAGGGGIYTLASGLGAVRDAINSMEGQTALIDFFKASGEATSILGAGIGDLVTGLTSDMDMISNLMITGSTVIAGALGIIGDTVASPAFAEGLGALLAGAATGMAGLSGAAEPLAGILGAVASVAGALVANLGNSLGGALEAVAPLLQTLGTGITPIIDTLGGSLSGLIEIIAPLIQKFTDGLAPILPIISDLVSGLIDKVWPLIESIGELLGSALDVLMPVLKDLFAEYGPKIEEAFGRLVTAVKPFFDVIKDFLVKHGPTIQKVLGWIGDFLGTTLIGLIDGVTGVFSGLFTALGGAWDFFAGLFTGDWERMWGGLGDFFLGIWEGVIGALQVFMNLGVFKVFGSMIKGVISLFTSGGGAVKLFGGIWNWLVNLLKSIINTILTLVKNFFLGIGRAFVAIGNTIKLIWQGLWNGVLTIARGVWTWITTGVNVFFTGVKTIFTTAKTAISNTWSGLWGGLKTAGSTAWNWIRDTAVKVFDGMKSAISGTFTKLKDAISSIWGGIKKAVGTPINIVIGFINKGLLGAYNWVAGKLGLPTIGDIPTINLGTDTKPSKGGGGAKPARAFQSGGYVDMPWSANDRDPYLGISPKGALRFEGEEFIVNRQATKKNRKLLEMINSGRVNFDHGLGGLKAFKSGGLVNFKGHTFSPVFAGLLRKAEEIAGAAMHISQGGYRPRTSYSGTSHARDAVDITGDYRKFIAPLRSLGIPTWDRAGKGNWVDHAHGVPLPGSGIAGGSAIWQAQDFLRGGDGLGGRDNGPRGGFLENLVKGIGGAVSAGFDTVMGWFGAIGDFIAEPFNNFLAMMPGGNMISDLALGVGNKLKVGVTDWIKGQLGIGTGEDGEPAPGYATGTLHAKTGWAKVGETGPEWVNFRGGERVLNARESRRFGESGTTINVESISLPGVTTWQEIEKLLKEKAQEKRKGYMMGASYGYSY